MKPGILGRFLAVAALFGGAGVAQAAHKTAATVPATQSDLVREVRHEILMYPRYSIWDNVTFRVDEGTIELMGAVNQPYKKSDIEKIVKTLPGVTGVKDEIKVLPLSSEDDRLRVQVARAIFRDPSMSRYAIQPVSPIHIIVDNGHVSLEGVVATEADKNIAGIRASGAGLSFGPVVNNLQVERPAKRS
jgi:hyperosmotically inducible periplasmic protein